MDNSTSEQNNRQSTQFRSVNPTGTQATASNESLSANQPVSLFAEAPPYFYQAFNSISALINSTINLKVYYHLAEARLSIFAADIARQATNPSTTSLSDFSWVSQSSKSMIPKQASSVSSNNPFSVLFGIPQTHFREASSSINNWIYASKNTDELGHLIAALHSIEAASVAVSNPNVSVPDFHWASYQKSENGN